MKEKLWDLTADSNHVKFYEWMWGIYAPDKYKTACPYYWAFGFSILILPLIVMAKLGAWILKPFGKFFVGKFKSQGEAKINAWIEKAKNATTDKELYDVYRSKCFKHHKYEAIWSEVYDKVVKGYDAHYEVLEAQKRARQAKIDAFKYGTIGTILTWVIGLIILALIGWGVYAIAHLITWPDFKDFSYTMIMIIVVIFLVFLFFAGASRVYDKYVCDTWVGKLQPLKWFAWPFKMLWTLVLMFVDMVKAIYTKSCPTINWK